MDESMLRHRVREILQGKIAMGAGYYGAGSKSKKRVHKSRKGGDYSLGRYSGAGTKAGAKHNPWLRHVHAYRMKHPNMPYREVLQRARASYHPVHHRSGSKTHSIRGGRRRVHKSHKRGGVMVGGRRKKAGVLIGGAKKGALAKLLKGLM